MTGAPVTAETVRAATWNLFLAVDKMNGYRNSYRCLEIPELTRVMEGPKRGMGRPSGGRAQRTDTYQVDGKPVHGDAQAIADAINAFRSKPSGE